MFSFGNDKVHNSMREIVGIQSQSPITVDIIKGWFLIEKYLQIMCANIVKCT